MVAELNHRIISGIAFLVILLTTLKVSSSNLQWNCNNPMAANYLYIILAFVSIYMFSSQLIGPNLPSYYTGFSMLFAVILLFLLLVVIIFMPAKYFVIKHLVWFLYLFLFAYLIAPNIQYSDGGKLVQNIVITVSIFLVLTFIAHNFVDKINLGWEKYLLLALTILILIYIVGIFTGLSQTSIKTLAIIGIVVFSLFILVDTKRLITINCDNPDYISNTMGLILDGLNLFSNFQNLNN